MRAVMHLTKARALASGSLFAMSAVMLTAAILFRNGCTVIVGQHMLFIRSRYLVVGAVALLAVGMIALVKIYSNSGKQ